LNHVEAPTVVLTHVRVIDGTGGAPREDQTIVISGGKILSVEPSATAKAPAGARVLDLAGYTVLPGLVGMHNHRLCCKDYFRARKLFECLWLSSDPEHRSNELRLTLRVPSG
jgi:N-acyl-D-aspartate/D-glutamate deacylase